MLKFMVLIILSLPGLAMARADLKTYLFQKINPKIVKAFEATTRSQLEAILGKPTLVENSSLYYELEDFKYAFSSTAINGKLGRKIYHPRLVKINLSDFGTVIDHKQVKPLKKNGVDDGLYREFIDQKLGIRLIFKTNSEMSLSTVEVFK